MDEEDYPWAMEIQNVYQLTYYELVSRIAAFYQESL